MAKLRTHDELAELRTTLVLLHGSLDPLHTLASTHESPGAERFSLRFTTRRAPIEARFIFTPGTVERNRMHFSWSHDDASVLPEMTGTIFARRFGPIVLLRVRARYLRSLDIADRLFYEAVGERLARRTFAALRHALRHLLAHLPARSTYELT